MFSPYRFATEHCDACGTETHIDALQVYRFEIICPTCFAEHEAASHSAAVIEFRDQSREWLKRTACSECDRSDVGELIPHHDLRYCRPCAHELGEQQEQARHEAYYGGDYGAFAADSRGAR